jgi:hypothetical protein
MAANLFAESLSLFYHPLSVFKEAMVFDVEHRNKVALFQICSLDEIFCLFFSVGSVSEEVVCTAENVSVVEFCFAFRIGWVGNQSALGGFEIDKRRLIAVNQFVPIDRALMFGEVYSPHFEALCRAILRAFTPEHYE